MLYKSIEEWRGIIFYAFSFYLCCFLSKIVCKFKANFVRKILNLFDDMLIGVKQDYSIVKLQSILLLQHQQVNQSLNLITKLHQSIYSAMIMTLTRARKKTIIIAVIVEESSQHFVD